MVSWKSRSEIKEPLVGLSEPERVAVIFFEDEIEERADVQITRAHAHLTAAGFAREALNPSPGRGEFRRFRGGQFGTLKWIRGVIFGGRFLDDADAVFLGGGAAVAEDNSIAVVCDERFHAIDGGGGPAVIRLLPLDGAAPVQRPGFIGGTKDRDQDFLLGRAAEFDEEFAVGRGEFRSWGGGVRGGN